MISPKEAGASESSNDQKRILVESFLQDASNEVTAYPNTIHVTWKKNYFAMTEPINDSRGLKYTCHECEEIFCTRLSLLTHSYYHQKPFCLLCRMYFTLKDELNSHMMKYHLPLIDLKKDKESLEKAKEFFECKSDLTPVENSSIYDGETTLNADVIEKINTTETNLSLVVNNCGNSFEIASNNLCSPGKRKKSSKLRTYEAVSKTVHSRFGREIKIKYPPF